MMNAKVETFILHCLYYLDLCRENNTLLYNVTTTVKHCGETTHTVLHNGRAIQQ